MRVGLPLYIILSILVFTLVSPVLDAEAIRPSSVSKNAATSLDQPNGSTQIAESHQLMQPTESNRNTKFEGRNQLNHSNVSPNYSWIPNTTSTTTYNLTNISINSAPAGAKIWIDGNYSGRLTPSKFTFKKAENHSFELRLEGYDSQMINLTTSNSLDVNVNLSTGPGFYVSRGVVPPHVKIDIKSNPPGAEVWKDNENTGKSTPFSELSAVYETHTYELRAKGHKDYEIPVDTDHDQQIDVTLN